MAAHKKINIEIYMEKKIAELIENTVNMLGFNLVKVSLSSSARKVLTVMIERNDSQNVSIADCRVVTKNISAILDVEDVIKDRYFLEVSSPGVERPLVTEADFVKFTGKGIKVRLKQPISDTSSLKGVLVGYSDGNVYIKSENIKPESGDQIAIPYEYIRSAKLSFSDEDFRRLLKDTKTRK